MSKTPPPDFGAFSDFVRDQHLIRSILSLDIPKYLRIIVEAAPALAEESAQLEQRLGNARKALGGMYESRYSSDGLLDDPSYKTLENGAAKIAFIDQGKGAELIKFHQTIAQVVAFIKTHLPQEEYDHLPDLVVEESLKVSRKALELSNHYNQWAQENDRDAGNKASTR